MFREGNFLYETLRADAAGWLRSGTRLKGIRVFRYHGLVDSREDPLLERNQHLVSVFQEQLDYLQRSSVLSLEDLLEILGSRRAVPRSAVVVTFDDGLANNVRVAEEMQRRRLPWCVFVPVGEVGDRRAMWLDEVSMLLLRGDARSVEVLGSVWPLTSRAEREQAFRRVRPRLKALRADAQRPELARLRAQFPPGESERLVEKLPSLRMLTWPELSELATSGVEVGSHGVSHHIHHAQQPANERLRELLESRRELERRLGRPCRSFAFPNGDFVPESPGEVESAGYEAAFTTRLGTVAAGASRYLLPRIAAPHSLRRFVSVHRWLHSVSPPLGVVESLRA